eukprot:74454_1
MSKERQHTAHNQQKKWHRNGIFKPKKHQLRTTKGMDKKFLLNQKYCRQGLVKKQRALTLKKKPTLSKTISKENKGAIKPVTKPTKPVTKRTKPVTKRTKPVTKRTKPVT